MKSNKDLIANLKTIASNGPRIARKDLILALGKQTIPIEFWKSSVAGRGFYNVANMITGLEAREAKLASKPTRVAGTTTKSAKRVKKTSTKKEASKPTPASKVVAFEDEVPSVVVDASGHLAYTQDDIDDELKAMGATL